MSGVERVEQGRSIENIGLDWSEKNREDQQSGVSRSKRSEQIRSDRIESDQIILNQIISE